MEIDPERECWICLEDNTAPSSSKTRFVQPCHCSLVAHESCLLVYLASQEEIGKRATCPQCLHLLAVDEEELISLKILRAGDWALDRVARFACDVALIFPVRYGFESLSCVLGGGTTRLLLRSVTHKWPSGLGCVPIVLILSSLGTDIVWDPHLFCECLIFAPLNMLLPHLVPILFPAETPILTTISSRIPSNIRTLSILFPPRRLGAFPPGPGVTLCLLPLAGWMYSLGRDAVEKAVLGSPSASASEDEDGEAAAAELQAEPVEAEPEILLNNPILLEAFQPAPVDVPHPPDEQRFLPFPSFRYRAGLAILSPFVASFLGSALVGLFPSTGRLCRLLGGAPGAGEVARRGIGQVSVRFERQAVWWRTFIGLGLGWALKDAFSLAYTYLQIQQRRSRRVISLGRAPPDAAAYVQRAGEA